jgi:hypothetical protein
LFSIFGQIVKFIIFFCCVAFIVYKKDKEKSSFSKTKDFSNQLEKFYFSAFYSKNVHSSKNHEKILFLKAPNFTKFLKKPLVSDSKTKSGALSSNL